MDDSQRIPMIHRVGPGSQPLAEADQQLDYMTMPATMATYHQPAIPEPEEAGDIQPALALLQQVQQALAGFATGGNAAFSLADLNHDSRELINQILGVGEVSISVDGEAPMQIQESVMAGLWRVQQLGAEGRVVWDGVEVGAVPECVYQLAFAGARRQLDTQTPQLAVAVMNAPSLLVELAERMALGPAADGAAYVLNLTLLPLNDADLYCLGEHLGVGPVTILSRGYGNCRIGSTACRDVWWIKYFNSEDVLILNTIEVVAVPEVARAAPEDIEDSAHRLAEILEIYQ